MTIVDAKAPDFELEGSDGKHHRLTDYRGRHVLLFFYPRDNTSG
jgi:peroxiredoxin Q/BCP